MEEIVKLYKIRGKIRCYIVKESNGKFRTCTGKPSDRSSICWTYDNLEDAIETAEEFVENYNSLSLSSVSVEAEDWLKDVKVDPKNKTPEGLFTKPASTIVRELLKLTKNDIGKAIQKITFYINRAGDNLSNANEVEKAKEQLQKKNELKHEKEESKVMAKSRFDVEKHQVPEDPQINLEFVRLSKDDKGYEDPKYYYFNDTVQNPEIWERFKKFIEKKWDMGYLDRQVSTSKKTAICPEAEAFIESISDYPHKTYFGDGLFGIWVFELPVKGRGKLPFLQFENPFSPFSRIICIHDNEDLKALNEELAKWKEKNGKTKVESSVKRNKEMKVLSRLGITASDFITDEDEIEQILKFGKVSDYTISDDGVVDVNGNVHIKSSIFIEKGRFAIKFGKVSGDFDCGFLSGLKSLEGAPKEVGGAFVCNKCENLSSLKYAPEKVGDFYCGGCNKLTSLEGAPKEVGGDFSCRSCENLKSLKGCPKQINGKFSCQGCYSLTSLEGGPEKVKDEFDCSYCFDLTSLEGFPKEVGKDFCCGSCPKPFREKAVELYGEKKVPYR